MVTLLTKARAPKTGKERKHCFDNRKKARSCLSELTAIIEEVNKTFENPSEELSRIFNDISMSGQIITMYQAVTSGLNYMKESLATREECMGICEALTRKNQVIKYYQGLEVRPDNVPKHEIKFSYYKMLKDKQYRLKKASYLEPTELETIVKRSTTGWKG